jgi:hypothetical protein
MKYVMQVHHIPEQVIYVIDTSWLKALSESEWPNQNAIVDIRYNSSLLNFIFEDKLKKITHVGFEVLVAVISESMFFWLVKLCGLEKAYVLKEHITSIFRVKE